MRRRTRLRLGGTAGRIMSIKKTHEYCEKFMAVDFASPLRRQAKQEPAGLVVIRLVVKSQTVKARYLINIFGVYNTLPNMGHRSFCFHSRDALLEGRLTVNQE